MPHHTKIPVMGVFIFIHFDANVYVIIHVKYLIHY
jgi:hypothetical protein